MNGQDSIRAAVEGFVNDGVLAGAVTLVWRDGRVVHQENIGWRDIEGRLPMERDTLFRIASMSKPVTSLAALMLYDEGRFALDEPITRWAPEFATMRVLRSPSGPLNETDAAQRAITFEDLLTHRSGLTYASFQRGPIAEAYEQALGSEIDNELSPDEWIARLASLPLIDQPGAAFHYSHSTDLLGLLIARMEGAPLGEVLKRRIFDPLGMKDTGFIVPPEKRDRRAKLYGFDDDGHLAERPRGSVSSGRAGTLLPDRTDEMAYVSGGQGLWSTADDYLAFARVFLGDGSVDGVRLLRPETLALMASNRLTEGQRAAGKMFGMSIFEAHGFGLGVAVVLDPEKADPTRCQGGIGTVGWPGAYGGWWQADPTDGSVMIFLAHNLLDMSQLARGIGLHVYAAITEFHALASALPA
jgi:CubicO group peptidase (beta-lactamase class C family)